MAQNKPFSWYGYENAVGFPGMKADAAIDTVNSMFCEGGCNPGDLVARGTDPEKQVKKAAASDKPLGIVVHDHKEPEGGDAVYYPEGYVLSVMTHGDIFVTAGGAVAAGDPVAYDASKGFVKGTETTPSGNVFMTAASAQGDVVKVHIQNPAAIVVTAG